MGVPQDKQKLRDAGKTFAEQQIQTTFKNSAIVDNTDQFPKFVKSNVSLGKVLGKGGFGTVYEVRGFEAGRPSIVEKGIDDDENPMGGMESRQFIADHCIRKGGDARYALKILSPEVIDDPGTFIKGIIDMATEARVLSDIEHPNIVKLRALAEVDPYQESFFIVMDRLYDTLEHRIEKWAAKFKRLSGVGGKLLDRKGSKKTEIMEQRLVAGFDLSAAVGYLHDREILYRDLKPENVGFDIRDDIKLFDFGLAKELTGDKKPDADGLYKLTAMTGSPIYMPPEVAMEQPYNKSCDVYSFAIMFWEMYSGNKPFELYTMKKLRERVWSGENKRPFVPESWPVPIKNLLRRSWSKNIAERPSFTQVTKILRNECVRVRGGNASGLEHSRRRSTFVFRGARGKLSTTRTTEM